MVLDPAPICTALLAVDASTATTLLAPDWMAHAWFAMICLLLTGYAVLDGFDLGVGIIHFVIGRTARERGVNASVIGPVWDGNEVWLVTVGGAMFAAFPLAYGTIFSAYMVQLMVVLFCLILRATSLEFRSKVQHRLHVALCDVVFCLSSLVATFVFGVAIGSLMVGIPIDQSGTLVLPGDPEPAMMSEITFVLDAFTISSGCLAVLLFSLHGAVFLNLKLSGYLLKRVRAAIPFFYWTCIAGLVVATWFAFSTMGSDRLLHPYTVAAATANLTCILLIPRLIRSRSGWPAFACSSAMIATFVFLFGAAIHPNLVISSLNASWNITIFDAASTRATLLTMSVVVFFAVPFILLYTAITYWTFRGRISLPEDDTEETTS